MGSGLRKRLIGASGLKLIETFVSKKRFKDYLQKNIAALLSKSPVMPGFFVISG